MQDNNNQNLDLDRFEGKCINDYVQFLLSFYNTVLSDEEYLELKDILYSYILNGNFERELLNSSNNSNLRNFFTRNGYKFRNFPMLGEFHKGNGVVENSNMQSPKNFSLAMPSINNTSSNRSVSLKLNHQKDEENWNITQEVFFGNSRTKRKKPFSLQVVPRNLENSYSPPPTKLLTASSTLPPFNRRDYFVKVKTAGEQSNMMRSKNGEEFFKTLSLHNLSKKRQFDNECRVYLYLQQVNPNFLRNSTCFLACYSDGILLSDGGMSVSELLKSNPNKENLRRNLQQFFPKVLELHCSGVSHNDLHCHNVVGFDKSNDVRLIDFGLAKTCQIGINMNFLQRLNNVFTKIFFAFARKYQLF
jgi:hypothetical protein